MKHLGDFVSQASKESLTKGALDSVPTYHFHWLNSFQITQKINYEEYIVKFVPRNIRKDDLLINAWAITFINKLITLYFNCIFYQNCLGLRL